MTEMEIEQLIDDIRTSSLRDFSAPTVSQSWPCLPCSRHRVDRSDIPVPELARIVLLLVLRPSIHGPEEKVRWAIDFEYKDYSCRLSLEKFGLHLYVSPHAGLEETGTVANQILKKIRSSIRSAEKAFVPLVKEQIDARNFTIINRYHVLAKRYTYFREKAEKIGKPKRKSRTKPTMSIAESLNNAVRTKNELFYNVVAMLDAYFSFSEHLFVLIAALCHEDIPLAGFIEDLWSSKYKLLFNIGSNLKAKSHYDQLGRVKERMRNFYAHGAFEKGGASLYIHIPNIGAVPAQLSGVKDSVTFSLFPVNEDNFADIRRTIDSFDQWLRSADSGVARALKYIESGLDVPCDKASLQRIQLAMESDKELDALIEYRSNLWAMHANMDY